ncbi:hypothetical protein AVEN_67199-1 [Araneus ventricosus]|uniref:Uncharacterized protein n=1 Tax=Araneus ventricosus TaxID=182803 RepID=A0A4Y2MU22_ARAVE|nr:hypothetical protein AVEN_67199-1 [Araneus ventricosus]
MGKRKSDPFSGQRIDSTSSKGNNFVIHRISTSNETFHIVSPFLVEKGITSSVGEVKSAKKLRSGDLLVEMESPKQAKQIVKLNSLPTIPFTVNPHATLNSSKGVISGKITEELKSQGMTHVRRITIRRDGQLLNTKHLILTFDSAKLPEHIKTECMRLSVRTYIPNPLRCFKSQRFGHSKLLAAGHLPAPVVQKYDMKVLIALLQKSMLAEARKLIKSQTPTPGNSYVSAVKISTAPSTETNPDISADSSSRQSASTPRALPTIKNVKVLSFLSVAPLCEKASASPDLTDFKLVTKKKKLKKDSYKTNNTISTAEKISKFYTTSSREVTNPIPTQDIISSHQTALRPFETTKPTSVNTEFLPMAVLPPLEKRIL